MEDNTLEVSPYYCLFKAPYFIPFHHYICYTFFILLVFLYNFLEIHFFNYLLKGFRGDPVLLTCNSSSELYQSVASKCSILHGRFAPTPWLCSPHLQTAFLSLFGNSPNFAYTRHIFEAKDGGILALDWLMCSDVEGVSCDNYAIRQDDRTPIVVVIPGLTSDSASAYIKHLAFTIARQGWNVVVCNHRGLGGVSITSDCFYNAGWTEDIRCIIDHIHCQYPEAPLYAVGTSIGANVLVKYLGEDGANIPLTGAASICSPWDLLICDRFINRRPVQKFYDRVLSIGLKAYAQLHFSVMSRLVDWNGVQLSRSVRDFDRHATRVLAKYETVDAYYRHSSCVNFVGNVSLPLLCVSALDDPVCTREAIPWDECRANENIILVATQHGGHLGYYEGVTAKSLWWVRAVNEFFHVLHSNPLRKREAKEGESSLTSMSQPLIDQGPFLNVTENGMVTATGNITDSVAEEMHNKDGDHVKRSTETISYLERSDDMEAKTPPTIHEQQKSDQHLINLMVPVRKYVGQISRRSGVSMWLLLYIAIVTTWPLVGSALLLFIKKRFKRIIPEALLRR